MCRGDMVTDEMLWMDGIPVSGSGWCRWSRSAAGAGAGCREWFVLQCRLCGWLHMKVAGMRAGVR